MSAALLILLRDKMSQGVVGSVFVLKLQKEDAMADSACKEEYTYQVGKITFIVTPVYKDEGEPMRDILLRLMLADLEPA
jgi:hypothetical protein